MRTSVRQWHLTLLTGLPVWISPLFRSSCLSAAAALNSRGPLSVGRELRELAVFSSAERGQFLSRGLDSVK